MLRQEGSGRQVHLVARAVVGRATRCDLVLGDRRVSGEHAVVVWDEGWWVRDLGSSNGTFVDGVQVGPGERVRLHVHTPVSFGHATDPWHLVDDAPPWPSASGNGARVIGEGGLVALPSAEAPVHCIFQGGDGRWVAEGPGGVVPVRDGQALEVDGVTYVLSLPEALPGTVERAVTRLDSITVRFGVSLDEEHVTAWLRTPTGERDLGARAHLTTLLALARARQADAANGVAPEGQGWVYQDEFAKRLGIDVALLNLHVFRARRQLADCGVEGAPDLVERRPAALQLRWGAARSRIDTV